MTKERKMGVLHSAWGDFMAACNLLMRRKAAEKGRKDDKKEKSYKKEKRRGEVLLLLIPTVRFHRVLARQPQKI